MLGYSFNEFVMIYSLYFICHYLFGGRYQKKKKKKLILGLQNLRVVWEK